jgi:hypothetical protein
VENKLKPRCEIFLWRTKEVEKIWQAPSKIRATFGESEKRKPKAACVGEDNVDERCQTNRVREKGDLSQRTK